MDLKEYYRKLREMAAGIVEKDLYVVSLPTSDGGKAGVLTQVPALVGCELVIKGRARLAEKSEIEAFEEREEEARAEIAKREFASRVQVQVVAPTLERPGRKG